MQSWECVLFILFGDQFINSRLVFFIEVERSFDFSYIRVTRTVFVIKVANIFEFSIFFGWYSEDFSTKTAGLFTKLWGRRVGINNCKISRNTILKTSVQEPQDFSQKFGDNGWV